MYVCMYVCTYVCMYVCMLYVLVPEGAEGQPAEWLDIQLISHQLHSRLVIALKVSQASHLFNNTYVQCLGQPNSPMRMLAWRQNEDRCYEVSFLSYHSGLIHNHERYNSWQRSTSEIVCPKNFKTWKAKSWIVQSLSRLGDMELQKLVTVQNLGCQVLKKVYDFISHNCVCQVLTNISKCVHVLEDQVMKDIILGKGLILKLFTPKSFKTWKAKSWILQSLSRLGDIELQKHVTFQNLGCQVLKKVHDFISHNQLIPNMFMSWRTKSWKT